MSVEPRPQSELAAPSAAAGAPVVRVRDLRMRYGDAEPVIDGVSLDVAEGQVVSLIGPSGSGKSTVLRAIAGLHPPDGGTVELFVDRRETGFLFQDDALLPWRTARQNVGLGLRLGGAPQAEALAEADRWLARLGLVGFEARYPRQLSGGQRKRVALAQVLARQPKLLLMDEPFASLDAIVRHHVTQDLLDWVERARIAVLLVTHDLEEAQALSDLVYLLSRGPRAPHPQPLPGGDPAAAGPHRRARRPELRAAPAAHLARPFRRGGPHREGGVKALLARRWARQTLALAALILLWEAASRAGLIDPFYAPPPSTVAATLVELFASGAIWEHIAATFSAALLGLAGGLVIGVVLGFAAATIPPFADVLEPVMILLNAIPRVILAPLFIIWFGIGIGSKVALSLVLVAVLIFFAVFSGIREVDTRLVERVRTLGGGRSTLLREVYLPSVTAWVMGSLKVAVGFAFTGAVVGEFVASSRGLGYLLSFAQSTYNAAQTLALIFIIMGFVLLLFTLAGRLERWLLHWRYA